MTQPTTIVNSGSDGKSSDTLSIRVARWLMLFAVIGVLVFGIHQSGEDKQNYRALIASSTAEQVSAKVSDVEKRCGGGGARRDCDDIVTVTTDQTQETYTYRDENRHHFREGDNITVTRDEGNPLWFMVDHNTGYSTADVAANGSFRVLVIAPSVILAFVAAYFIYKWTKMFRNRRKG